MSDVVDWLSAGIGWTEDGWELSAPFHPAVTARQAKLIADAVEAALHEQFGPSVEVGYVEPEDGAPAELLITDGHLLHLDPGRLRSAATAAANLAANEAFAVEQRDEQAAAGWLHALQQLGGG